MKKLLISKEKLESRLNKEINRNNVMEKQLELSYKENEKLKEQIKTIQEIYIGEIMKMKMKMKLKETKRIGVLALVAMLCFFNVNFAFAGTITYREAVPAKYISVHDFSEGLAAVTMNYQN